MCAAQVIAETADPGGVVLESSRRNSLSGARPAVGLAPRPARHRGRLVIALLTCTVLAVVALAAFCMDVLSSARAYVGGESLWSKAQKDAVRTLMHYATSHNDDDWYRYRQAIAIPLGDRKAREELETPRPDLQVAREGFLAGGIHPGDISGMVRLFRWFRHVDFLDRAIAIWAEGDGLIAELQQTAGRLHQLILSGADGSAVQSELARIDDLDRRLTPLEMRFSDTLGEASRQTRTLLTAAVLTIGILLIACSALFVRRMTSHAGRYEEALREANARLEERVTERTRELTDVNRRLVEVDRLKSEFLATMSHELRTPLNGILGLASLLQDGGSGAVNADQRRRLGLIRSSGQHLLALIEDVLDLSQLEAGRVQVDCSRFDVAGLIGQIDASLRPLAQAKGLAFVCETRTPELSFYGDPRKCLRVVRSLADNAVKFTERGEVRIMAGLEGSDLEVTVSDTGVGISAAQLPMIFQAFQQLDGSLHRAQGGAGLGLYLSHKLVELMGGTIGVESTPMVGSRFSVRLPQARRA